ncbi:MAG TPA: dienelactone hydrolase family protein [Kofleriaceae bacterium]|nr:dienelactone hydrolase family protein [Kofleriaceae bacterium]
MPHSEIQIETADGVCPAHVYHPAGAGPWPGVLMFIDGIGMRPALQDMAERLAGAGYYVLLPDLFYRAGPYTAPEPKQLFGDPEVRNAWFHKMVPAANAANIMRDCPAFFAHLAGAKQVRQGKFATTGYCMGGRLSLMAAGTFPDRLAAAASYHGGNLANDAPDSPHLLAGKIKAKVYVAGAIEDQSFPDEQKQRLEQALTAAGVDHQIETYQARHGWVPSDTPVHDAAAAERHWQTLLALLQRAFA